MKRSRILFCAAGAILLLGAVAKSHADYASEVLAQGPLTYWRFSETYGYPPVATNVGSLGATGNGLYTEVLAHPPGPMPGSTDPAAAFNGADQKIDVPFNAAFNPPGAFTVEFWAMITNYVSTIAPLQSRGTNAENGYLFFANNGGDNKWWFRTYTGTTRANVVSTNNVATNQWTHVVGVRDASGANHLYINGVEAAPPTAGGYTAQTGLPLRIGAGANEAASPSWFWPGYIDEVAIYPTALTAAQIAAHYQNATNAAPAQSYSSLVTSDGAVGYWRLNETAEPRQIAANLGSLGSAGNAVYLNGTRPEAGTLTPPTYPALEATNRQVRFNGSIDQVRIGGTNVPVPWTATFWVNRQDALGASAVIMTSPSTGLKLEQWEGAVNTTHRVGFTAFGVADYFFEYSAPIDTWVQLTFVGTPNGTLLYTNGFLAESNPASITLPMTRIGGYGDPPRMQLDEAATFSRALLEGQIRTLYLTAIGDANPPGFVNDVPIVSPAGTIYATTAFTLSIDAYGAGPLTYQWRKNGTVVGTSRDFTVSAASATDAGSYDVIVANAHGSVTSATVTVAIDPAVPPTIDQPPVAKSVFAGGDVSFTVSASGTTPFTYQWKKGGVNIGGATNQTLVLTNVTTAEAGNYSVGVTNVAGGVVSAGAALTIPALAAGSFLEAVVTNRPVNYWRLGEASGTTAFDSMGRLDGTYGAGVMLGLPGGIPMGGNDTAVQFDGTSAGQIALNAAAIQPPWTAIFWVKRPDLTVASSALINETGLSSLRLQQWQNTAHVGFTRYGVADYDFGYTTPAETWVQLVFVGKAASTELYVNGALAASNPNAIPLPRQSIGNAGDPLVGQLDEVALYGYDLTAEAIAQMYSAAAYGPSIAPTIDQQPVSRSVYPGGTASFRVAASGTHPITYQWQHAGTNLPGATNTVLILTNCSAAQAGAYTVGVTNIAGGRLSATATLTLLPLPANSFPEAVVARGPIAYWRLGETTGTNAFDYSGGHDGVVFRNVTLGTPGPASPLFPGLEANNTAFAFDGTDAFVEAGSLGLAGPLSVAAWVRPNALAGDRAIAGESGSWAFKLLDNELRFTTPGILDHDSTGAALVINEWQHVAATFAPGTADGAKFYVNGRQVGAVTASALTQGSSLFWIGKNQWAGQVFDGAIDEVVVYDKILSPDDVAAMYAVAAYGTTTAPFITAEPVSQTAVAGLGASLSVGAQGSVPLVYQWRKDGTPIPGATTSRLTFASVSYADEGSYTVIITNAVGSTNSAPATFTVMPPPSFANLTNGLVLHLKFDGNYSDTSGRANDATAIGAPTIVAGKIGSGALRYNTVVSGGAVTEANYVVLPPSPDLYFATDVNFSAAFWIKFTGLPGDLPFLCNNDFGWGGAGITLAPSYNLGGWSWYLSDAMAGSYQGIGLYGPDNGINDGVWHHLVYTFDRAGLATVYRDGVMENQTSITNGSWWNVDTGRQLHIGQAAGLYPEAGVFEMDDFGIWRKVLTPYEALSIYNAAQFSGVSFDVYGPVRLDIDASGANVVIAWQAGTLESNDNINNPNGWTAVTGAAPPKFTLTPGTGNRFYRVRLN